MSFDYEIVRGLFRQSELPSGWRSAPDTAFERLGLIDDAPGGWHRLALRLKELQQEAPADTCYKLLLFNRHGQGVHNLAAHEYGYAEWLTTWGRLEGDGTRVWRNAELTELGVTQARRLNEMLKAQIRAGMPAPTAFYCSPLVRTVSTLQIAYDGLIPVETHPRVREELRETVNMICEVEWPDVVPMTEEAKALKKPYYFSEDRRGKMSELRERFPTFDVAGLPEDDEIWREEYNETRAEQLERTQRFLDSVFVTDEAEDCVAISAHGGFAIGVFHTLNAPILSLRPCDLVPFLVKATRRRA